MWKTQEVPCEKVDAQRLAQTLSLQPTPFIFRHSCNLKLLAVEIEESRERCPNEVKGANESPTVRIPRTHRKH